MHLPEKPGLLPAAICLYALAAAVTAPDIYVSMLGIYSVQAALIPALFAVIAPAVAIVRCPRAPMASLKSLLLASGPRLAGVTIFLCIGLAGFTTFKLQIPEMVPFYADPLLARLDAILHGGNPGRALHTLLPDWAVPGLVYIYGTLWFALWFGLVAYVALSCEPELRHRYYWAMALTILLVGTVFALLLSSVGPVLYHRFYEASPFTRLETLLDQGDLRDYVRTQTGYLLESYRSSDPALGTGISAMPSMHLAIATLNAHLLATKIRWLGLAGWSFVVIILFGSVYLGWHYAIDGYASILLVSLIWRATAWRATRSHLHTAAAIRTDPAPASS